ncbi:MAG: AMP-binding protein, partial [Actinomycetota bacterium]|nr:AMP-binding protein [Actinomycetota bacterium]
DLSSWKVFVCAGAAVPEPVLERAEATLPCVVLPGWGMTECALLTVGRPSDSLTLRLTDGCPLPGNQVRVIDEGGEPVVGVEGDLQCSGSELFVGYMQGRDVTEASWEGPWFDTGDRAVINDAGYIRITGRSKDIIIRGGENVPVKEIEDLLLRHPLVSGVAIVGKPDARLGEIGCVFVMPSGEAPTLADLTEFLDTHSVTRQFWPEHLVIIEDFPMTPSGKVQKYKLRQNFLDD